MSVNSPANPWRSFCALCGCCLYSKYQYVLPDEDWVDMLTEDQRRACVTERTLFVVSQHVGGGWEVLGMELGLPYVCVDRCATSRSSLQMQTLAMLNTWRQLKGRHATMETHITALQRSIPYVLPDEDWVDMLTEDQRRACVTEKTLFVVSQHVGGGWEVLGMELGLPYVCVDRCATSRSSLQMQTLAMLNTWRQLKGRHATMETLITALQRSIPVCTVDMFAIIEDIGDK